MLVCFMHTEQNYHFPAVCFWKNLISDAVKYWFSLTSVKALIFLLGLDIKTFQTRFFFGFLGFHKIFVNDLTLSPHCHVFVNAFLLPPTYGCCWCFSKSLELGILLWLWQVQWWWSWKLTHQLFLWLHSLFVENQALLSLLEELQKRPGLGERDSRKFSDIQEMLDCVVYRSFNVHMIR